MGRADVHLHTTYSDGLGTVPAVLESARRAGLDVIAITDHDEVALLLHVHVDGQHYCRAVLPWQ